MKNIDFIQKDEWPPSSPDFEIASRQICKSRACSSSHKSVESLKNTLMAEWNRIPQEELRKAVGQFRPKQKAIISKKGGYIE